MDFRDQLEAMSMQTVDKKIMRLNDFNIRYQPRSQKTVKKTVSVNPVLASVFEYVCCELDCKPSEVRNELIKESVLANQTHYRYNDTYLEFLNIIYSKHGRHDPCIKSVYGTDISLKEMDVDEIVGYYDIYLEHKIDYFFTVIIAEIEGYTYHIISGMNQDSDEPIIKNGQVVLFTGMFSNDFDEIARKIWIHHALKDFDKSGSRSNAEKLSDLNLRFDDGDYYQLYEQSSESPFASFPKETDTNILRDYILALSKNGCEIDVVFTVDETRFVINSSNMPLRNESFNRLLWSEEIKPSDSITIIIPNTNTVKTPDRKHLIRTNPNKSSEVNLFNKSSPKKNRIGDIVQYFYGITVEDLATCKERDMFVELQIRPQFAVKDERLDRHQYNRVSMKFILSCDFVDFTDLSEDSMKTLLVNQTIGLFIYDFYASTQLPWVDVSFEVLDDCKEFINLPNLTESDLSTYNHERDSEDYIASHLEKVSINSKQTGK